MSNHPALALQAMQGCAWEQIVGPGLQEEAEVAEAATGFQAKVSRAMRIPLRIIALHRRSHPIALTLLGNLSIHVPIIPRAVMEFMSVYAAQKVLILLKYRLREEE